MKPIDFVNTTFHDMVISQDTFARFTAMCTEEQVSLETLYGVRVVVNNALPPNRVILRDETGNVIRLIYLGD